MSELCCARTHARFDTARIFQLGRVLASREFSAAVTVTVALTVTVTVRRFHVWIAQNATNFGMVRAPIVLAGFISKQSLN